MFGKCVFTENPMFMNGSVEESFYLWHSDITTAARHYLIWAYLLPPFLSLSTHWPCTIWCPYMEIICPAFSGNEVTFERANILWEFFTKIQECHRSGAHNGRAAAFGDSQWTHFRLISELFYTQRSLEGGNSGERANIWKIFCSSELQGRSLLGKSARADVL